jgi:3-polyprenyl-4-hydroxybenzoate decarboxylase
METKREILHVKDRASTRFEVPFIMKKYDNKGPILLFEELKNYKTKAVPTFAQLEKESVKFERAKYVVSKYVEGLRSVSVKILCTPIYILGLEK